METSPARRSPLVGDFPAGLKEEGRGAKLGTRRNLCSLRWGSPFLLDLESFQLQWQ